MTVLGGRKRQVNITLSPARLQGYGLTVVDVQRALATQNVEVPGDVDPRGRPHAEPPRARPRGQHSNKR